MLADPAFAPGRVQDAGTLCDQWFANDASLASFVCRSIFRDLINRNFTDPQAVPTSDWQRFVVDVVPRLVAVLDAIPAALPADPAAELRDLVIGYHSSV